MNSYISTVLMNVENRSVTFLIVGIICLILTIISFIIKRRFK